MKKGKRKNELGAIRRSQIITTYGPGAIIDFRVSGAPVSVISSGLDQWDERAKPPGLSNAQVIFEPRLQEALRAEHIFVDGFRLPPVAPELSRGRRANDAPTLVGVRFPKWLQCPKCSVIAADDHWDQEPGDPSLYCGDCSIDLGGRKRAYVIPSRFVAACENGHLQDFPYHMWVQHKDGCNNLRGPLSLVSGEGSGLANYTLGCRSCTASRPMEGIFDPGKFTLRCGGRRPWIAGPPDDCGAPLRTVQRGASNVYFSSIASAISIPPWSDDMQAQLREDWSKLRQLESAQDRATYVRWFKLAERTGRPEAELIEEIEKRVRQIEGTRDDLIRSQEYLRLDRPEEGSGGNEEEFEARRESVPPGLDQILGNVVRVVRLREVRALVGFTRITPPTSWTDPRLAPLSAKRLNWLPAIENRGEGIFISLTPARLMEWEVRREIRRRAAEVHAAYKSTWERAHHDGSPPPKTITARMLLLHSLSHALMRQLSLECGYSSASLRERVYAGPEGSDMAGILVFTATPDADGTLGGLCRQAKPMLFGPTITNALRSLQWCASDPLCRESRTSLSDPHNKSACHACLLVPETSCEEFNRFLDRVMIVGSIDDPAAGFAAPVLT